MTNKPDLQQSAIDRKIAELTDLYKRTENPDAKKAVRTEIWTVDTICRGLVIAELEAVKAEVLKLNEDTCDMAAKNKDIHTEFKFYQGKAWAQCDMVKILQQHIDKVKA